MRERLMSELESLNGLHGPVIPAVQDGFDRPFWSVMIPTYNPNPAYLEQTLRSVLDQDPGSQHMQIELIDDGSTNFDPEIFVSTRGSRASFYRQPRHMGMAGNWNTCVERARGRWIHLLHQDDLVFPGFYQRLRKGIDTDASIGAAFCHHSWIDAGGRREPARSRIPQSAPGILSDWLEYVFVGLSFTTPSIVVKRGVYERLGGFDTAFDYALDWDMWKRIAPRYPLWYEPAPLAACRRHPASTTRALMRSGANIAEIRRSIEVSRAYLPPAIAADMAARARAHYASHAVSQAATLLFAEHDPGAGLAQLREARRMRSD